MTELTPLQKLDDAIHEFAKATGLKEQAWISGWVITYSTVQIEPAEDSLPMVSGANYAIGPQTTMTDAAGLAKFISLAIEKAAWDLLTHNEEES